MEAPVKEERPKRSQGTAIFKAALAGQLARWLVRSLKPQQQQVKSGDAVN
jgi:hypothetical protein